MIGEPGWEPLFPAVKKPARFDREMLRPPELPELAGLQERSVIIDAYVRGVVSAVSERMERAAEAMITDERGWGILAVEDWHGLDFRVAVWLHPEVPFGEISHHKVDDILQFIADDPVLSAGGGRLIE